MSYQGRSLDDLPLAAYTTGTPVEEPEEEAVPEAPHMSQQEAVALAMGIEAPPPAEPAAPAEPKANGRARIALRKPSLPKPSLPRPSLPKPSAPRLPRFGGGGAASVATDPPFLVTAHAANTPSPFTMSVAQAPAAKPVATGLPGRPSLPNLGGLGGALRNPRTAVRDPRVLFGAMIAVGAVLLGSSILLGGGPATSGAVPGASASTAPGAGGPVTPGPATITVEGDFETTLDLTGTAGFGKPADGQLVGTWDDGAGSSIALTGPVGSGARTTSARLVLTITVMRNDTPVTFTSEAGECTVGMAQTLVNITGTFVCPEITSNGGRFTVKLNGSYKT